jgi:hypothetical protein
MKAVYVDPHPGAPLAPERIPAGLEDEIRLVADATARKLGARDVEVTDVHTEVRYALHIGISCHADTVLGTQIAAAVREVLTRHSHPAGEVDIVVEHHGPDA